MLPPAPEPPPELLLLLLPGELVLLVELELEQAARAPGTVTSPAAAAIPFSADRLLTLLSSWGEVCFIETPCGCHSAETRSKVSRPYQDITGLRQDFVNA